MFSFITFVFRLIFNLGVSRKELLARAVANYNNPKIKKLTFRLPKFPIIQVTTLGSLIKKLRIDKDLYQENLASFIDVTEVTVTNWENDRTSPNRKYIDKLAKFFNVNAAIFLELNNG